MLLEPPEKIWPDRVKVTPALTPRERETRPTALGKLGRSSHAPRLVRARGAALDSALEVQRPPRLAKTRQMFLPLPGGEGWGEGGNSLAPAIQNDTEIAANSFR